MPYADKAEQRAAIRRSLNKLRTAKKEFLRRVKSERGCADCGERDSVVLDFHHRDPARRVDSLSRMTGNGWQTILSELEKCDVLCANCHRRRHAVPVGAAS